MNDKVFFDSNTLLYLVASDAAKMRRTEALLRAGGTISVQVLNEITLVSVRKFRATWAQTADFLALIRTYCRVVPLTERVHDFGRALAERHQFQVYDAMIVAAALLAGCDTLYSQDMHDGLRVDHDLTIRNPFRRK